MTIVSPGPLLDALVGFLRDDGWPVVEAAPEESTVRTRFAGNSHEWSCAGRTFELQGQVVFDSALPLEVPQDRQASVAALLLHVNWTMITGAFALDPLSGTVRFRTSLLLPDAASLTPAVAKGLVYANVLTVDRCVPTIAAATAGEVSLTDALDTIGY
jgi:hypothetical protein